VVTDLQLKFHMGDGCNPLATGSEHYVAALQTKPGELEALGEVSMDTWAKFTPLIQIVGPKSKAELKNADNITAWTGKISEAVGSHAIFLDILRLEASHPVITGRGIEIPVLERIYWSARKRNLTFVPVVRVGEVRDEHVQMVADASDIDGNGVALRWAIRSLTAPSGISVTNYFSKSLTSLRTDVANADLLIDLSFIEPDTEIHVEDLEPKISKALQVGEWRNVVLLGTSIPAALSCVKEGTVGEIVRQEWRIWNELSKAGLKRALSFGDYAIQHPKPPQEGAGGGPPRANIRYTAADATIVARGRGPVSLEGNEQYVGLCKQIVDRTEFSGSTFSWGDGVIEDCARGRLSPGSQSMWRGAGTSHHLRFITDQLELSRVSK